MKKAFFKLNPPAYDIIIYLNKKLSEILKRKAGLQLKFGQMI